MDSNSIEVKLKLPWKSRLLISAFTFFSKACTRSDGTINRKIYNFLVPTVRAPSTKLINKIHVSSSDVSVDPSRNLWFRLFVPGSDSSIETLPLIIYFHGGGFSHFGADSKVFDDLCCRLAAEVHAVVASVNYRLAPEHRFPCPYDDAFDTIKYIDSQNSAVLPSKIDLKKCFIAGDSAGGNIAHHVTVRARKKSNEFEKVKVIGLLLLQPFFGGEERTESELRLNKAPMLDVEKTDRMWKNFLPEYSNRSHEAANVFGGGSNSDEANIAEVGFPSTLLFVGGFDPLQDWQRQYCEGLRRCGKEVKLVEYPNAIHGFYSFPQLPESAIFLQECKEFVQKQIETSLEKEK